MAHEMVVPSRVREMSRSGLQHALVAARHAYAEKGKLGGAGPAVVSHGTSMIVRHAASSLLGLPKDMPTWQQILWGLTAFGAAGFRIGVANAKMTPAMVVAAAAAEGVSAAAVERVLESLAKLQPT